MATKIAEEEILTTLAQCTGTTQYYKHFLGGKFTDGVQAMAELCQAYWLIDVCFSYRMKEPFQIWTLTMTGERSCVVTMKEDSNRPELIEQKIPYTDFPLKDGIKLYLIDGVLLLPSEY